MLRFFDQSSGHTAFADDALNAKTCTYVKPGGSQPKMQDTYCGGNYKEWCIEMVHQKEWKMCSLKEGVNVTKMKADQLQEMLQDMHIFKVWSNMSWKTSIWPWI